MKYSTRLFSVTCPATTRPPSTAKASFRRLLGAGHIRQNVQAKQSNKVTGPSILRFASRKTEGKAIVSSNDHCPASKAVPRRLTTAAAIVSNPAFNKQSCKLHSHQQCHLWHTASPSAVLWPRNHQARTRQQFKGRCITVFTSMLFAKISHDLASHTAHTPFFLWDNHQTSVW